MHGRARSSRRVQFPQVKTLRPVTQQDLAFCIWEEKSELLPCLDVKSNHTDVDGSLHTGKAHYSQ